MNIDIRDYTNNDNIYNLYLEVEVSPWEYGNNRSINVNGKIISITNKYGYKIYATSEGFELDEVKDITNEDLNNCDLLELFDILDNIVSNL